MVLPSISLPLAGMRGEGTALMKVVPPAWRPPLAMPRVWEGGNPPGPPLLAVPLGWKVVPPALRPPSGYATILKLMSCISLASQS